MVLAMIFACVLIGTAGQLLLKWGMNTIGAFTFTAQNIFPVGLSLLTNPGILLGTTCYAVSLIVWLMVLSRSEVSYAYPLLSLGYVITAIAAYFLFGESLSFLRLGGIVFIILGVCLITK